MAEAILIIGGGVSGVTAAEHLRRLLPEATITLVDQEDQPLYSRVLLPHYIKGKVPRAKVFLRSPDWYEANRINWHPSTEITHLDHVKKIATLHRGQEISYTKLILATGTTPKPSSGLTLQTLADADRIVERLPDLNIMHIVGGGFMACEFLNIAEKFQLPAHLYLRGSGLWNALLPAAAQAFLRDHLRTHHVTLHAFDEAPLTAQDTFLGLGAPANLKLAEDLGLELVNGGIATTEFLSTALPDVYAIGDIAAAWSQTIGKHLRVSNWQNALQHGRAVAQTIAGQRAVASNPTAYATDLLGLSIIFMGDTSLEAADDIRQKVTDKGLHVYYYQELRLCGVVLIGDPLSRQPLLQALGQKYVPT